MGAHRSVLHVPEGMRRPHDGRWIAGVAAFVSQEFGIDPVLVRAGFVILTFVNGLGALLYAAAWVLVPAAAPGAEVHRSATRTAERPLRRGDAVQSAAFGAVIVGLLMLLGHARLWVPGRFTWPLVLTVAGYALVWVRTPRTSGGSSDARDAAAGDARRAVAAERAELPSAGVPRAIAIARTAWRTDLRGDLPRLASGGLLVVGGVGAYLAANGTWRTLRQSLLGSAVVLVGLALILGPWMVRLFGELTDERSARVRSDERAELAAHLHDSVLQTLAIIQRHADDRRRVMSLARRQERELRGWLFGDYAGRDGAPISVGEALQHVADTVEGDHGISVEFVLVGDRPIDERSRTVVLAAGEALVNAAKHSQAPRIDMYAEVTDGALDVYVRDRGVGFDPAVVAHDRHGLADSIRARMDRIGGSADVVTAPGEGCEVHLAA